MRKAYHGLVYFRCFDTVGLQTGGALWPVKTECCFIGGGYLTGIIVCFGVPVVINATAVALAAAEPRMV